MGPTDVTAHDPIDLNSASVEQLGALDDVGPRLAERIVAYRAAAGPFLSLDHLMRVPGVDRWLLERLRSRLAARAPEVPPDVPDSWSQRAGWPLSDPDESLLSAEDEDALDAELHAYEELEVSHEELPEEPFESEQAVLTQEVAFGVASPPASFETDQAAQPAAQPERPARPAERRRGWAPVVLGALFGFLATILVLVLFAGTLGLASRRMVLGLSRNLATMQANQELAWERLNQVTASADALEQRLAELEEQAANHDSQLAAQEAALEELQESLAALEAETMRLHAGQDEQIGGAQTQLGALIDSVEGLEQLVDEARGRVASHEASLRILRALIRQLAGEPVAP